MDKLTREQQLELVVKFTMEWLEETGCICNHEDTRQACVAQIGDKDAAILDVMCERALQGGLDDNTMSQLLKKLHKFNIRKVLED